MMLLTCRRDNSTTAQPRAGVRVNPAESAAEVSMGSEFRYTEVMHVHIVRSIAQEMGIVCQQDCSPLPDYLA